MAAKAAENPNLQFIDVREVDEYAADHASGTVNIPMSEITGRLHEVDTNEDVYLICRSGGRSAQVSMYLEQAGGAEHVYNVDGGTDSWRASSLPMEK